MTGKDDIPRPVDWEKWSQGYDRAFSKKAKSCSCGSDNLCVWLEDETLTGPASILDDTNLIECLDCGRVVYGGGREALDDWNSERYDDGPSSQDCGPSCPACGCALVETDGAPCLCDNCGCRICEGAV